MTEQPVVTPLTTDASLWAGRVGLALNAMANVPDDFIRVRLETIRVAVTEGWERHKALAAANSDFLREVAAANATVSELRMANSVTVRAFERFKEEVRQKAIDTALSEGWCIEGLNEALEELGLDPYRREFVVSGRATYANREWSVQVTADDEDEARSKASALMDDADDDSPNWDGDLDIDVEIQHVELAQ